MKIYDLIIPAFITAVMIYGLYKRVSVFDTFCEGAYKGIKTAIEILPALSGLVVCVGVLKASGFLDNLGELILPFNGLIGFPEECASLVILKPFSGSGATAMLNEIFTENHPDSFTGRVASVICASTETTFYTIAIYFGSAKLNGSKRVILSALIADITGFIFALATVRMFFY